MSETHIKVWDLFVRVFHWSLVASFLAAYLTQEQDYERHLLAGYAVMGLILARIVWGLVGGRHARFSDFVREPFAVFGYLKAALRGQAPRFIGHNPAGGYMVILLLLGLAVVTASGVALDAAENRAGPLGHTRLFLCTDAIAQVHEISTNIMLGLIALHFLGVLHASWSHAENLVWAMLTGRKRPTTNR